MLSVPAHGVQLGSLLGSASHDVEAIGITESELLHDRQLDLSLEYGPRGFVHIDNIGLIGKDGGEVDVLMGRICRELRSQGLLIHELCRATRCCDILGIDVDRLRTLVASTKYEKLRLTLQWILGKKRVSGQMLERVMGHVTYISLVRRPLLSAFAAVYKFQRAHHHDPTFLFASCRSGLQFLVAMPLMGSDWSLPWSGTVLVTDACEGGYGVVSDAIASASSRQYKVVSMFSSN